MGGKEIGYEIANDAVKEIVASKCFEGNTKKHLCIVFVRGGGSYSIMIDGVLDVIIVDVEDEDNIDSLIHEMLHVLGLEEKEVLEATRYIWSVLGEKR